MGPPVMTLIEEGRPDGVLLCMNLGDGPFFCVMPDDGRDYEDVMLSEIRPYPAMDAIQILSRISGITIREMISKKGADR